MFNITSGGADYPGYPYLRDEAVAKLADYIAHFRTEAVRHAELHYVNLIEIPRPHDGNIKIEDYFKLRLEFPDTYGPASHFSLNVLLGTDIPDDILEVRIRSELTNEEADRNRFRSDWHIRCAKIASTESSVLRCRLDAAHDCLVKYFRDSVTDLTWELFKPSEER